LARFIKENSDEEQALGAQYGIRSIPTLAIFQSGKEIARISGGAFRRQTRTVDLR